MLLSYIRTVVLYLVLIFSVRMMGKRQIGQMEAPEFVVTMLVANLASIPMQDGGIPLFSGVVPILTVLGLELALSGLIMRSLLVRRILCGKPVILIENGKILQDNLRQTRVTLDELMGHLREKDVLDLQTVQYAILETNGNVSVFPFPKDKPATAKAAGIQAGKQYLPLTLVSDGVLIESNLRKSGKSLSWLERQLASRNATIRSTWLFTLDGGGNMQFFKREGQ